MRMRVDVVLSYGGEDLEKLLARLGQAQPDAEISVTERREEDGSPRVIRWEHPAPSAYGRDCFALWDAFAAAARAAWGTCAADNDLHDASFVVLDDRGRRVGRLERTVEEGGWRDMVDGEPVSCGSGLEVLMPDGTWLRGRYEMAWPDGGGSPVPYFHAPAYRGEIAARIGDGMVLRRPGRPG